MKKSILILSSLLFVFASFAQKGKKEKEPFITIPYDSVSQKYAYSKVLDIPGIAAHDLYQRSKNFTVIKFSDDKFSVDEADAKLIDLGSFSINPVMEGGMGMKIPIPYTVIYNVTTSFKEGKCKYDINNIKLSGNSNGTTSEQTLESFAKTHETMGMGKNIQKDFTKQTCELIDVEMKKFITELENALNSEVKKSDW